MTVNPFDSALAAWVSFTFWANSSLSSFASAFKMTADTAKETAVAAKTPKITGK